MFHLHSRVFFRSYKKFSTAVKMSFKMNYEDAVQTLNSLQSNKVTLEQVRNELLSGKKCTHLEEMEKYLLRTGVSLKKLDQLSVIHIAGTKGKGSTSAMCESVLRQYGLKTGFYSSPHLVVVRERIRLNGEIIDKEKFSQYFSDVYHKLEATKAHDGDMPKYFHFLTVMALNVFLEEKVDVAILEVGIGGAVDSTNIVRTTPVVGITALGLDHTSVLGNTIEEIAKAKAGIMKPGCEAYTVNQPPEAMAVLHSVASEVQCSLHIVPDYNTYDFPENMSPQLPTECYRTNASLSIQLAHAWLRKNFSSKKLQSFENDKIADFNIAENLVLNGHKIKNQKYSPTTDLVNGKEGERSEERFGKCILKVPFQTTSGLSKCSWPGRYQRMNVDFAEFFIDGAHTKESVEICANWFSELSGDREKILIFSATGDRNAETLLRSLISIKFDSVFFVVPVPYKDINERSDTYSIQEHSNLVSRCQKHLNLWHLINKESIQIATVHECISDACNQLKIDYQTKKSLPSVLVTGSLYLVGGVLAILDPNLNSFSKKL